MTLTPDLKQAERGGPHRQRGITLTEVLVALVVLSIGLLGVGAMQLDALQSVHSAHYRSVASLIASDFEERLWLKLADEDLNGCPDATIAEGSAAKALIEHWSQLTIADDPSSPVAWLSGKLISIRNFNLSVGTVVTTQQTIDVPITVIWNESRFSNDESTTEQFTFNVRVPCKPGAS